MGRAVDRRGAEQSHVVGLIEVVHEIVDEPARRWMPNLATSSSAILSSPQPGWPAEMHLMKAMPGNSRGRLCR